LTTTTLVNQLPIFQVILQLQTQLKSQELDKAPDKSRVEDVQLQTKLSFKLFIELEILSEALFNQFQILSQIQ
jgi:hypothetical protein